MMMLQDVRLMRAGERGRKRRLGCCMIPRIEMSKPRIEMRRARSLVQPAARLEQRHAGVWVFGWQSVAFMRRGQDGYSCHTLIGRPSSLACFDSQGRRRLSRKGQNKSIMWIIPSVPCWRSADGRQSYLMSCLKQVWKRAAGPGTAHRPGTARLAAISQPRCRRMTLLGAALAVLAACLGGSAFL